MVSSLSLLSFFLAEKGFKCSHCRKNFATERILREHIRLHINLFKCPMCDMTCPFQSTLALHVRYRHMDLKPFQCNFCDHRYIFGIYNLWLFPNVNIEHVRIFIMFTLFLCVLLALSDQKRKGIWKIIS